MPCTVSWLGADRGIEEMMRWALSGPSTEVSLWLINAVSSIGSTPREHVTADIKFTEHLQGLMSQARRSQMSLSCLWHLRRWLRMALHCPSILWPCCRLSAQGHLCQQHFMSEINQPADREHGLWACATLHSGAFLLLMAAGSSARVAALRETHLQINIPAWQQSRIKTNVS